eukprot:12516986-Alexandrium_andersonii.AAC.1
MPLTGARPSSTRAEIAALIIAHAVQRPLKLYSDSLNAVKGLRRILGLRGGQPRRPWGLIANGDLWKHLADLVAQRGLGLTQVYKIKGHAEQAHVQAGLIT